MLGIRAGGADALIALSLLSGGDYAVKGAQHVGARSAVRLVQHLLQGSQVHTRSNIIEQCENTNSFTVGCLCYVFCSVYVYLCSVGEAQGASTPACSTAHMHAVCMHNRKGAMR